MMWDPSEEKRELRRQMSKVKPVTSEVPPMPYLPAVLDPEKLFIRYLESDPKMAKRYGLRHEKNVEKKIDMWVLEDLDVINRLDEQRRGWIRKFLNEKLAQGRFRNEVPSE